MLLVNCGFSKGGTHNGRPTGAKDSRYFYSKRRDQQAKRIGLVKTSSEHGRDEVERGRLIISNQPLQRKKKVTKPTSNLGGESRPTKHTWVDWHRRERGTKTGKKEGTNSSEEMRTDSLRARDAGKKKGWKRVSRTSRS